MDYFEDPDTGPTCTEQGLLDLIEKLEARITELQATGTDLLMAKRAVDRRSMVRHFHREVVGANDRTEPGFPASSIIDLRLDLIREEYNEFYDACETGDLIAAADALGDIAYVVEGTALAFGIDLDAVFAAVHASNMTKEGSSKRKDGKISKECPGYKPPDIEGVLFGHQLTHKGTK